MTKQKGVKNNSTPKKQCEGECKKTLSLNNFYNTNSAFSFDKKLNICKKCVEKMIDYNNIETVYKILQLMDIPFLIDYWKVSKEKTPDNPWGNYIRMANSKINEFKNKTWKDSIFENGTNDIYTNNNKKESNEVFYNSEWRGNYTQSDLEYLENYYLALQDDFKIVTRNHKDYARKIAKASLAMDRAYDDMLAGVTGSDKRYKDLKDAFDQLSKSAQFSENTRGANDVGLGCFGLVFEKVEEKKWIPQHTPLEKDDFDKLIDYFSTINKSLK